MVNFESHTYFTMSLIVYQPKKAAQSHLNAFIDLCGKIVSFFYVYKLFKESILKK